jgi:hypothetical protein
MSSQQCFYIFLDQLPSNIDIKFLIIIIIIIIIVVMTQLS